MQNGVIVRIEDMPIMPKLTGKGNQVNASQFAHLVHSIKPDIAYVERVHAMPKQGVSSVFQFGHGVGIIHGVLAAMVIPMKLITPQAWKKYCGLIGKHKDAARSLAITAHPYVANQLSRKKDIGRADAICIGDYATSLEK
jgi:crossover junction endodeoxyribonuclease RuvC